MATPNPLRFHTHWDSRLCARAFAMELHPSLAFKQKPLDVDLERSMLLKVLAYRMESSGVIMNIIMISYNMIHIYIMATIWWEITSPFVELLKSTWDRTLNYATRLFHRIFLLNPIKDGPVESVQQTF